MIYFIFQFRKNNIYMYYVNYLFALLKNIFFAYYFLYIEMITHNALNTLTLIDYYSY